MLIEAIARIAFEAVVWTLGYCIGKPLLYCVSLGRWRTTFDEPSRLKWNQLSYKRGRQTFIRCEVAAGVGIIATAAIAFAIYWFIK